MLMIRRVIAMAGAVLLVGVVNAGTSTAQQQFSEQDRQFLMQNTQTNLAEISLGEVAQQQATRAEVRDYAEMLVADHQRVLEQVRTLAERVGMDLPDSPNEMQLRHAEEVKSHSAEGFDEAYLNVQVEGHMKSVSNTETEISSGSSPEVIELANTYLPIAQRHLAGARQLLGQVPEGVNAGTGGLLPTGAGTPAVAGLLGLAGLAVLGYGVVLIRRARTRS
jgi:putative membrane protein